MSRRVSDTVTFLPHDITMPPVVSKKSALAKIEDLMKLLNNKAKPFPFQEHHEPSLVDLQQLFEIFIPTSTPPSIVKNQPAVSTYKAPRVSDKPTINSVHAQQLPRASVSPTTSTHRCPTRSKHSPTTENQCNAVMNLSTGALEECKSLIKGKDKETWLNSCSNELRRLTQGIRDIKSTNCIFHIHHLEVATNKKAAYARTSCSIRPNKRNLVELE